MAATAEDHEHRVTPRELFFDLVFVFAFTQVATPRRGLRRRRECVALGRRACVDVRRRRVERVDGLGEVQGAERVALARDVYAYAHFPMIVGIVLFAFAMKKIIGHVDEELDSAVAFALCGGSALYLLTYSAIRMRILRRLTVSTGRFVAALVLLLMVPLATAIPSLAALGLVTAVWVTLHVYELLHWREARARSRAMLAS